MGSPVLLNRKHDGKVAGAVAVRKNILRGIIEVGFIIFLFYANLLMGEFERTGTGRRRGLVWAVTDVVTSANFGIALIAAFIGYVVFEALRKRC